MQVAVVVIGRNEASRIGSCLAVMHEYRTRVVYVDSGSIDGSADIAETFGVDVIRLREGPFTAARGRRVGLEHARAKFPELEYVQFIDGDCELCPRWIETGCRFLRDNPATAAVVGRLREKHPERSIFVRLTDMEWELPLGKIDVVGGISLMRVAPLLDAGGWKDGLANGEELDLSSRIREAGWTLHRLSDPMCTHDIGITTFREFWKRSLRAGYGYCNLSILHHATGPRRWRRRAVGSVIYGIVLPTIALASSVLFWPIALVCLLLYLLLPVRLAVGRIRRGDDWRLALAHGGITTICKSAMAVGVLRCIAERTLGRNAKLIEYKKPTQSSSPSTEVKG
jgi:glycosyltransferase involved in cell wall biosynthesis